MFISPSDINFYNMAQPFTQKQANDGSDEVGQIQSNLAAVRTGNQMYDNLFAANPYNNLSYNRSPWQSLLTALGFRTDYDKFLEQQQVNKQEYDAQVSSIIQQNDYNDPASQAQRMKLAGQNPDLLGTQGVSDSASPTQDVNGMDPNSSEEGVFGEITQKLWNFGTGILNCFQIATGFSKDMLSLKQMQNAVDGQDVDLLESFMKFQNDYVLNRAPSVPFENDDQVTAHWKAINRDIMDMPKRLHFNRRQRRVWNQVSADMFSASNMTKMTEHWKNSASNLDSLSKTPRYRHYSTDNDEWKAFDIISSNLGDLASEVYRFQQKHFRDSAAAGSASSKYDQAVSEARLGYRDPATGVPGAQMEAAASGMQNALRYQTSHVEKSINSTMSRIVTELERQANDGDLLSAGLLLAFNIFKMSNWSVK